MDYLITREELEREIPGIKGYHSIGRVEYTERDMMPVGQYPLINKPRCEPTRFGDKHAKPYCFMEIMERDADRGNEWGAKRFAITFLYADGIMTYYQLFVREYCRAPWLFLLQDHGLGGNYDRFGKGGLLDAIISASAMMMTL